jgi:LPS export ABC transporter protein LptC
MICKSLSANLFLAFLFGALCFVCSSCKGDLRKSNLITSRANVNIEKGKGVEINYSEKGMVKIKAIAPTATRFTTERPYFEFPDGIKLLFFNAIKDTESTLTAKYATAVENSHEMTARDSVVVVNKKGEILNTDELIWDETRKIIYSNSFVKIRTADEIIYGNGMTANQNFTDYVIKNITGTIKVKSGEL